MIWSQRYGETSFTVPLFDSFMKRQMPSLEKHKPKRRRWRKIRSDAGAACTTTYPSLTFGGGVCSPRWRLPRIAVVGVCAQAADSPYDWKLTLGEYFYSNYAGSDVNLRWRASDTSAWAGAYADSAFGSQFRTGADTSLQVAKYLQLQPSVQLATRGFLGGGLNVQVGGVGTG